MANPQSSMPSRKDRAVVRKTGRKSSWGLKVMKGVLILMLILLLALIGVGAYLYWELRQLPDEIGTSDTVAPEDKANVKPITLLLLGVDYRDATRTMLTDVIMVASLNPNSKTATLVSIPRDTYIDPDGLKGNKANSFYSTYLYGDLSEAPKDREERDAYALQKIKGVYSEYLDIPIDYVSVVDFQSFVDIVDLYGGLTINVDQNMCHRDTADGTYINLKAGEQHLTGKETLDFVRYRKSMNCDKPTKESNDFERNARQQQVIEKLLGKVITPQGLFKVSNVFDVLSNHVRTDLPSQQIDAMIRTYLNIDLDKIEYYHLEGDWDGRYVRLEPEKVEEASELLKMQLLPDGPPTEESEADQPAESG